MKKELRLFSGLLIFQVVASYWTGFWFNENWKSVADHFPILNTFNFSRVMYLTSPIWYILFAMAIRMIAEKIVFTSLFLVGVLFAQVTLAFSDRTFYYSPNALKTFHSYYAKNMFSEIEHYIGKPKTSYRVASLGLAPAVSLYNGFYTVDGYSVNYPLKYKASFRKIIAPMLDKESAGSNNHFLIDKWGSKLYVLCPGVVDEHYIRGKKLKKLNINTEQLYKMGGRYFLSGYEIDNSLQNNLHFMKKFSTADAYWDIYLYKVGPYTDSLSNKLRKN